MPATQPAPTPTGRSEERRKYARRNVRKDEISVRVVSHESFALMLDVSESGIALQTHRPLPEGSTRQFRFQVPGKPAIVDLSGLVVSCRTGRAGVKITSIDERSQKFLREWLSADQQAPEKLPTTPERKAPPSWPDYPDEELYSTVAHASSVTCATGAAIAWRDAEGMVCRSSTGIAPGPGVRVHVDRGLSGECVRTGSLVCCNDCETDLRLDPIVCRELQLRSLVIVPILSPGGVTGLLEVFSDKPSAFADAEIDALGRLAAKLGSTPPPACTAAPSVETEKLGTRPLEKATYTYTTAPLLAGWDAKPAKPARPVGDGAIAQMLHLRTPHGSLFGRESDGVSEAVPETNSALMRFARSRRRELAIGAAVLLFVGLGIRLVLQSIGQKAPADIGVVQSQPSNAATGPDLGLSSEGAGSETAALSSAPKSAKEPGTKPRRAANVGAEEEDQEAVQVTDLRPSTPSTTSDLKGQPLTDANVSAPVLAMGAGREDRTLVSSLTAPTASVPVLDLTHVPVASPARVVKRFNPVYPPAAFSNGREGDVVLDVTVKPNGKVGAVHVADGQPEFARAAVDAVRLWRYEPYRLNGKPSEVTTRVVVRFRLPSRK